MNTESHRSAEMSIEEARSLLLKMIEPLTEIEEVDISQAFKRVLARDLNSPLNVPAFNNSAMDGFAVRHGDLSACSTSVMAIAGTALAGRAFDGFVTAGQALRIMTGAMLPAELDTVVPQELCTVQGTQVHIAPGQRIGQHCRAAGEDIAVGSTALPAGLLISAADVGLAASLGLAQVPVRRKPRIAIFSTGDELLAPGMPHCAGKIYDSNRYILMSLLAELGLEAEDLGIVPDRPEALEEAFRYTSKMDLVISSGGVSVGEADFTRALMNRFGQVSFATLAIRPGRPLAFGRIGDAWYFGLPGNPVAVMITYLFLVRDALLRLLGARARALFPVTAFAANAIHKRKGRTEYQRGIASTDANGRLSVVLTGQQGSGLLSSMTQANCIIALGPEQESVLPGEPVSILLFQGLL